MTRPGHIFISHGSENRDRANELAHFLETRGARAWIAPRDVRPGMDYSEQLQLAIEECAAFIVLVTEDSNKSPYVRVETEMAFSINKPIFPVRVADVKPAAGLALFLKIKHWTDAYGNERDANLERLGRELQVLGAIPQPRAPEPAPAAPAAPLAPEPTAQAVAPPPPPPPPSPQPAASSWGMAASAAPAQPVPGHAGSTPGAAAPQGDGPELAAEEVKRAMIGPNADHYIESWRRMDSTGSKRGFNVGGLLGNYLWLAYRKMWIPLAAGIGVIVLAELIAALGLPFLVVGWMLIIGFCLLLGLFGDYLYRWHLRRVAATGGSLEQLRARGGTSMTGPAALTGIAILAAIISTVATNRQSSGAESGNEARAERAKDAESSDTDRAGTSSRDGNADSGEEASADTTEE